MVWKRPESVPFPSVWSRFKGRKPVDENGKIPSFRIQDPPDELKDRIVQFMFDFFLPEEPIYQNTGCRGDKEILDNFREHWYKSLTHRLALVCLVEDENGNLPEDPFRETPIWPFMEPIMHVNNVANVYERFGVTEYMSAYGLAVDKKYRGQNIGYEMLKAREPLCRAVGLKLTATIFSARASQVIAKRAGFKEYYDVTFEDLVDKHNIPITKKPESLKYMALKFL